MGLAQTFRNFKRLKQIANVLFKHELGYLIENLKLKAYLTFHKKTQKEKFLKKPVSLPAHLRLAMEELGGTFIKLGQLLSLRPDLVPKEYCEEFSKLLDDVKPFHYIFVKRIIEKELNKPLGQVFISFDKTPVAAASIGQVHKAVLKNGQKVAVKIMRPGIEKIFETDIDILYHLAHLLEKHYPETKAYNFPGIVKEFESYTKKEFDYTIEARNIERFYENFKKNKFIKVPKVHWDYTKKRVLTMEFIEGKGINEVNNFKALRSSKKEIIENITKSFIKQILEFGFFHADPHPGNIFLLGDNRVALLDYGIVGRIDEELRENVENILIALIKPDKKLLAQTIINLGIIDEGVNLDEFKKDLSEHLGTYYGMELSKIEMSSFFYDILELARKYKMRFPENFILLIKAMITTEGLSKKFYPEFNFVNTCKEKVNELIKKRKQPSYIFESVKQSILDIKTGFKDIPKNINEAIKTIKLGKVKMDVEDSDVKRFALEMDRSSNRITFGIIIAALIVSAALIILANLPPLIYGIPAIGIIFFIAAFIFFIVLLVSVTKEKGGD